MIAERTGDADGSQAKRFPASDTRDSANRGGGFNAVAPTSFPQVHRPNERTGFGPGTMIMTRDGEIAVEWLDTSHHVLTRDNGFQPILWIGRRTLSQTDLIGSPDDLPVRFPAGCLGPNCPAKDLEITADLRLLIADPLAELLHASHEVLAPAKSWRDAGIAQPCRQALPNVLTQILCAGHEIILGQGVWLESMCPEAAALRQLFPEDRAQVPGWAVPEQTTARPCLSGWEAKFLIDAMLPAPRDKKLLRLRA